jgi:hypothetical protein
MIIDAYATDTTPSYEVRRRALEALTNEGEPMSEVTYDALRKRLAQAEEELSIWKSVFPDIAPERVLPDRSLLHAEIEKLRAALRGLLEWAGPIAGDTQIVSERAFEEETVAAARAALGEKE